MKVFAIASGEYSDYGINTICSTREIAEKTMALLMASDDGWHSDYRIEEYDLDVYKDIPFGYTIWIVYMDRDGNSASEPRLGTPLDFAYTWEGPCWKSDECYIHVAARDAEHAVKIANEYRTKALLAGTWPKRKEVKQ
jgi:hypothetical protein